MDSETAWRGWRQEVVELDSWSVSGEYVIWSRDELDIRGFLIGSLRAINPFMDSEWERANAEADKFMDPEFHDGGDVYGYYVEQVGVEPITYMRHLSLSVLKDAWSLLEVYLERSANEIVRRRGGGFLATTLSEESWRWEECKEFYLKYLGPPAISPQLDRVRWMRNKATHLRDQLRTPAGREDFENHLAELGISDPLTEFEKGLGLEHDPMKFPRGIELTPVQIWRILNLIREHVNGLAQELFPYSHGDRSTDALDAVALRQPPKSKDFNGPKRILFSVPPEVANSIPRPVDPEAAQ